MNIKGKTILLIMSYYFGYEIEIRKELEKKGAIVYSINQDFYNNNFLCRFFQVYFKRLFYNMTFQYYVFQIRKYRHIDIVFVIKGSTLYPPIIEMLKQKYKCKYILYQWDSVKNNPYAVKLSESFDSTYTFDPEDAKKYGWNYRPLFFNTTKGNHQKEIKYEMSYICSLHSKRADILFYLLNYAKKNRIRLFDYVYVDKLSFIRQKYLKGNDLYTKLPYHYMKFSPLSSDKVKNVYGVSKCLVDYKSPDQDGLTIRSIEAIGHECKLITNNRAVIHEKFYCNENVFIYDEEKIEIPIEFIRSPYRPLQEDIYSYYSLEGWITEIFCL